VVGHGFDVANLRPKTSWLQLPKVERLKLRLARARGIRSSGAARHLDDHVTNNYSGGYYGTVFSSSCSFRFLSSSQGEANMAVTTAPEKNTVNSRLSWEFTPKLVANMSVTQVGIIRFAYRRVAFK
jgi:hypothetical protein